MLSGVAYFDSLTQKNEIKTKMKFSSRKKQKIQELTPPSLEEDRFIWLHDRIASNSLLYYYANKEKLIRSINSKIVVFTLYYRNIHSIRILLRERTATYILFF